MASTNNYVTPPGRVGNLTEAQESALKEFKERLVAKGIFKEDRMDDHVLLRFLRARKFDVNAAELMLIACEKWRADGGVDTILETFKLTEAQVTTLDKYYPQYYHKMDKDGRPVYIEHLGKLDIPELKKVIDTDGQLRRLTFEYEKFLKERLPACSAAVGHHVETSCTIMDLKDVSFSNFYKVSDYVQKAAGIGQNYYPETMGKFYVVNASWTFTAVWSIIKGFLDAVTVDKISILGKDYKAALLAQIPAENLPVSLGGTCTCPGGCTLADAGPWNVDAKAAE